jgi:hypothetical protein
MEIYIPVGKTKKSSAVSFDARFLVHVSFLERFLSLPTSLALFGCDLIHVP